MTFSTVWGLCLCMWVCISCVSDELSAVGGSTDYVSLHLQMGGTPVVLTKATEPGEVHKNEDVIKQVDVYVFNSGNGDATRKHYQRAAVGADGKVTLSLRKEDVVQGTYDVYVVANCALEASSMEAATTTDALMALCTTTEFKFPTGQAVYEPSFLMDGKVLGVTSLAGDDPLSVDLKRAAAKIRVNIKYGSVEEDDGTTTKFELAGVPQKKMINYATRTTLWEDSDLADQPDFDRQLMSMTDYVNITENEAVFYSYANTWEYNPETSDVDLKNETYILLDIPVRMTVEGEDPVELPTNYYSVSLNGASGERQQLERNHLYDITVTVQAKGSATEAKPVALQGTLRVQPWKVTMIDVGSDDAHYLEVSDDTIRITNSGEDNSVIFYSSEDVTNVRIKEGSVKYIDKFGVEKSIPQTEEDEPYPDEEYMPEVNIGSGNTIHIESKELINVPKTFTIVVTSGGIEREIYVEQYPLEYITSTQGWYSYREDFGGTIHVNGTTSGGIFSSKVVREYYSSGNNAGQSDIDTYSWRRGELSYSNDRNPGNARMYHVHVTTTPKVGDVAYRLGYPKILNGQTDNSPENANLVSPSFMIASQLGTVNPASSLEVAAAHCRNYVEVTGAVFDSRGNVINPADVKVYDDWRLPTKAEIEIIKTYQNMPNSAMDEVLSGQYYYTASGPVYVGGQTGNRPGAIRCIRDVK